MDPSQGSFWWIRRKVLDSQARLSKLKALRREIRHSRDQVLQALNRDLGKCMEEAYLSEYMMVVDELDYTIHSLPQWMGPTYKPTPIHQFPSKGQVYYRPYGRVAIASPWNYPFLLAMVPAIGALAAGNRVVLKTSKKAYHTSLVVKEIFNRVYDQDQVLVYGTGDRDRDRFMEEDMDFLFFTGSTKVGRKMAKLAGEKMIPSILELGGKSPVILSQAKDLKQAARRIFWGKILNAGQTCVAPDYCLVRRPLLEPFLETIQEVERDFFPMGALDSPHLASIIDRDHYQGLEDLLKKEGIYRKDQVDPETLKFKPQVFQTDLDSPFMDQEIFGPFLPLLPFDDLAECKDIIDRHKNPLALYLFTEDEKEVTYILDHIAFGGGAINDTLTHLSTTTLPFGGVGESGMGVYHGRYSFESFSRKVSILRKSTKMDLAMRYPPYKNFDPRKLFKKWKK